MIYGWPIVSIAMLVDWRPFDFCDRDRFLRDEQCEKPSCSLMIVGGYIQCVYIYMLSVLNQYETWKSYSHASHQQIHG